MLELMNSAKIEEMQIENLKEFEKDKEGVYKLRVGCVSDLTASQIYLGLAKLHFEYADVAEMLPRKLSESSERFQNAFDIESFKRAGQYGISDLYRSLQRKEMEEREG
jgi:hypothetical protein